MAGRTATGKRPEGAPVAGTPPAPPRDPGDGLSTRPAEVPPYRGSLGLAASARRWWRQLTSMRTALLLLFLLAVAAVPGSLLPQRDLNAAKVDEYLRAHPELGRWLDRFGFFDVFGSPWFAAIYLLLFVSLVGCLVPRMRLHVAAMLRRPPGAPRRFDRLPEHRDLGRLSGLGTGASPTEVAARLAGLLRRRRWRTMVRTPAAGTVTVSAEKGYLRETGNLLFHFSLVALLIGVALGSGYGWQGGRLLVRGPDGAFCNTLQQYDEYGLGARVDAADLPPFCVELVDFSARYLDDGQPVDFDASLRYTEGSGSQDARTHRMRVNEPLRLGGANLYLIAHGYAPVLRYTDRYGKTQEKVVPFLPVDPALTSEGVAMFPDANIDPATGKADPAGQVAFEGLYLPTSPPDDPVPVASRFPAERDPGLLLFAYAGDLGLDAGIPRSVYSLDRQQVEAGRLKRSEAKPKLLRPGETWSLTGGGSVTFVRTEPWVTLSVRHDPGERLVLVAAVLLLVGLLGSLTVRRRRVWFRLRTGKDGTTRLALGGLSRTGYAGFGEEVDALAAAARRTVLRPPRPRPPAKET